MGLGKSLIRANKEKIRAKKEYEDLYNIELIQKKEGNRCQVKSKKVPGVVEYEMRQDIPGGSWGEFVIKGPVYEIMSTLRKRIKDANYFKITSITTYTPEILRELISEGLLTSEVEVKYEGWKNKLPDDIELYLSLI